VQLNNNLKIGVQFQEKFLCLQVNVSERENWLKWYYWLVVAILIVLGISTLVPVPGNPRNLVGYSSVDPFAPISAILLWVIAGAIYWFGKTNEKKP
jgi:polyferredoxin